MSKWIFFDVGNVILNDDPTLAEAYNFLQQALAERGHEVTFDDLMAERRELIKSMSMEQTGPYFQILGRKYLGREEWMSVLADMVADIFPRWSELNFLIPGIDTVISRLNRKYKLGIIANQPREAIDALKKHDLWDYFSIKGISNEVGFQKPDPEFFRWALDQARCRPEEAVMIGDRIDNDIIPARKMGLKTLWLRLHPHDKGYNAETDYDKAYLEEKVATYKYLRKPRNHDETPDFTADSVLEIIDGVESIFGEQVP